MSNEFQQIEAGKQTVRGYLENLATEFHEPRVNELIFKMTDQDFDYRRISLVDPKTSEIVLKLGFDDLADCPATPSVQKKLKAQLQKEIQAFFARTREKHGGG